MESLWLALHWGSPIGTGIFLVCLGGMVYLLSKADEISKRTKAKEKEMGLEKRKDQLTYDCFHHEDYSRDDYNDNENLLIVICQWEVIDC